MKFNKTLAVLTMAALFTTILLLQTNLFGMVIKLF